MIMIVKLESQDIIGVILHIEDNVIHRLRKHTCNRSVPRQFQSQASRDSLFMLDLVAIGRFQVALRSMGIGLLVE